MERDCRLAYSGSSRRSKPGASERNALIDDAKMIMLPGMAADERLFEPQRRVFPGLVVPPWIEPEPREPLDCYARRMASQIDPRGLVLIGGVSFGGMVALEMAYHLGLTQCVMISSIRSPVELPWRLRALGPLARIGPTRLAATAGWAARWLAPSMPRATARRLGRLAVPQSTFLRWACWAVLRWQPTPEALRIRVHQIQARPIELSRFAILIPDRIVKAVGTC